VPDVSLAVAVIIVAAGRGARMGVDTPKQYLPLGGIAILSRTLNAFIAHPMVDRVMTVIHADDGEPFAAAMAQTTNPAHKPVASCHGAGTRQESVAHGLKALADSGFAEDGIVLIHDAARPMLGEALITRAIAAANSHEAAIPVLPVADTMVQVDAVESVTGDTDRSALRAVQTPQAFRFGLIHNAHAAAAQAGYIGATDDAGIARWAGHRVATFAGEAAAFKITTADDLARARLMVGAALTDIRSATGYDVHAFGPGDHIMLGGVRIAHDRGVIGHSDADVLLHALTDALLGCIADGDIGSHFPPSDMRWKGAASRVFLAEAVRRVTAMGGEIRHLDGTVVSESPRIGPHRDAIRATIAEIAGISVARVGLKATTSERLGFTGRREGIAALATATVALPFTRE
jgi:2-C-methyl-D-erythritol 4-phosphate cytidylyltransferase/2-C-methyl-D-erythritol 2,4-cyclodiphosphate synthase